jgi:hypothetical protein
MSTTRSNLVAARIYESDAGGSPLGIEINCLFNPFEYTVSKSNQYSERPQNRSDVPRMDFEQAGPQTLQLDLTFDTYAERKNVGRYTDKLWKLMEAKTRHTYGDIKKVEPPYVTFSWGSFRFVAVITSMTQRYTLFLADGTPVRAQVQVAFTEFKDRGEALLKGQNPTSGGGAQERIVAVKSGERLDSIAAQIYGDAGQWRRIAECNRIVDPLNLPRGLRLAIPQD